jgi:hypothetical protein
MLTNTRGRCKGRQQYDAPYRGFASRLADVESAYYCIHHTKVRADATRALNPNLAIVAPKTAWFTNWPASFGNNRRFIYVYPFLFLI